ncbi:HepT-like ribonuclease domain-containing protein [Clostridium ihumii]|uniref:HepT-like ribonuclease domain-containing protein n=1 Tax=Clostridium ihumii TaxID=1470356 RepID=UPI003D33A74B
MSPYYKYKKEKFLEKYKCAYDNLGDLKDTIKEYKKNNSRIIRRAMFAFFQDFTEYVIDMCESYIVINEGKLTSSTTSIKLIEQASLMGFFDENLKAYLIVAVKLRNRYTHDYYQREFSEEQIEKFCFEELAYLEIFLEESKDKVILKYKKL